MTRQQVTGVNEGHAYFPRVFKNKFLEGKKQKKKIKKSGKVSVNILQTRFHRMLAQYNGNKHLTFQYNTNANKQMKK